MNAVKILLVTATMVSTFGGPSALGSDQREGLNFGTTLRLNSSDDRSSVTVSGDKTAKAKAQSQQMTPYIGYAFSSLNLGLQANIESRSSEVTETTTSTSEVSRRTTETDTRGLSVFLRFNFGSVMFMEAGGGLYSETAKVDHESSSNSGAGAFNGQREEYVASGSGPGYHLGGGIELPIANDFYFSAAYLIRLYQLRDVSGDGQVGKRRGNSQKREVVFGVAHYVD